MLLFMLREKGCEGAFVRKPPPEGLLGRKMDGDIGPQFGEDHGELRRSGNPCRKGRKAVDEFDETAVLTVDLLETCGKIFIPEKYPGTNLLPAPLS
jgi:hypothetical protein